MKIELNPTIHPDFELLPLSEQDKKLRPMAFQEQSKSVKNRIAIMKEQEKIQKEKDKKEKAKNRRKELSEILGKSKKWNIPDNF